MTDRDEPDADSSAELEPSAAERARRAADRSAWSSRLQLALGVWLIVSEFLWPHGRREIANAWFVGALVAGFGGLSLYVPWTRRLNIVVGAWLIASTLASAHVVSATRWHDVVLGGVVLATSLSRARRFTRA